MKKKITKKLALSKETLRILVEPGDLKKVMGGATTSRSDAVTCESCGVCNTNSC